MIEQTKYSHKLQCSLVPKGITKQDTYSLLPTQNTLNTVVYTVAIAAAGKEHM